ncbi:unnamed protein product [Diatraea saccharalis]|uniref:SHSP domain-containing protein n=1 Tax=Diatraea saccharalis TaxID=40085 RepID=A0A9N9WKH3_9NEOP|nr:unnamed protein product [Diatraea saccharalis]
MNKHSWNMIAFLVLGLLAAASAAPAPQFSRHRHSPFSQDFDDDFHMQPFFDDDIFDTQRFWQQLDSELRQMNTMIENFHRHFPTSTSSGGIVGNEYRVVINLHGFDEKDISVKARDNVLMVQAVHKTGEQNVNTYMDLRTLPDCVNASGVWTFANDVLTVVFPLKSKCTTETPASTEGIEDVTKGLEDREEMDNSDRSNANNDLDADVGVSDNNSKDEAIRTNEIQKSVEATTYAVDLKNEVEFVPVHYK